MAENILPRSNAFLLGQQVAEDIFLRAWKNGTMHHAWILSGPHGVGKATLAYRIARFLVWADWQKRENYTSLNVPENAEIFQQIAKGSYPDVKVLERDYIETDRKKIISSIQKGEALDEDDLANLRRSAFIRVDDVRKINEFLAKTSFNDGWRVVIIDAADDMNKSAANALLKILEEPPARTVLLLVSHNIGTLLPTIRSRCAKLNLRSLNDGEVSSLLRRYRAELSEEMVLKVAQMSRGSIGRAILYADLNAPDLYNDLCSLLYAKQKFSIEKMLEFCAEATADEDKFSLLQDFILQFIKENLSQASDSRALYECWSKTQRMYADCININMDKKQMLIKLLTDICKVL